MGFIYQFTFPSGKQYIGKTTKADVRKRWHLHRVRQNNCWAVANAIRKYGWHNVHKEVLLEVSDDLLDEYEVKFIDTLGTLRPGGYNLTPGGDYNPMDSEEVRAKLLKSLQSDDHRKAQGDHSRAWHKDKAKHAAWLAKNTEAQRKPERRKKQGQISKAGWADADTRKKRIDGLKRAFSDPTVSQKRKDAAAKGVRTAEATANMMAGHARNREAKLAKLPPAEREKKRKDMEKRRDKAREKYRATHRVISK
jgi:group I intron endonuclease